MADSRPLGSMKLAVLDAHDQPLVVWSDVQLAKELIARVIAEEAVEQPRFRLVRKKKLRLVPIETAVREALHELSLEVVRL